MRLKSESGRATGWNGKLDFGFEQKKNANYLFAFFFFFFITIDNRIDTIHSLSNINLIAFKPHIFIYIAKLSSSLMSAKLQLSWAEISLISI